MSPEFLESARYNQLSNQIIAACIEVHRQTGPGLLESVYQVCLEREFDQRRIPFKSQHPLPVYYKGSGTGKEFILDFLVDDKIIVEIKSVEKLIPVHEAQLITYLKLSGRKLGLLINFNCPVLKTGIKRLVYGFNDPDNF